MERVLKELLAKPEILRPYYAHLGALAVAVLLGLGVAAFKVSSEPPAVDTADRWPFPQWTPFRAGPQRQELAKAGLWAPDPTKARPDERKVAGPPWRFIGTMREGASLVAVIELDQGKRIQRLGNGQPLPNGAVIKKIDTSTLFYDENGAEKALRLFGLAKTDNLAAEPGKN